MYQQQQNITAKYIAIGAGTVLLIGGGIIGLVGVVSNMTSPQSSTDSSQETVQDPDKGDSGTPYSGYPSTPDDSHDSSTPSTPSEPSTPTTPTTPEEPKKDDDQNDVQKKVILDYTTLNLYIGASAQLKVTVEPYNANDRIVWSSNNLKVATVENGKVVAKKAGTAVITVTVNDIYSEKCTVKVQQKPANNPNKPNKPTVIYPTGVSVNKSRVDLVAGQSVQLTATVSPNNASNKTVTWSSQNSRIATVHNGKITAVSAGSTLVLAKTHNGKTASVRVYVQNKSVPVQKVKLNVNSFTIKVNGSYTLNASVSPSNATNKSITWSSSNTSIATVSGGKVIGKKAGTATITATAHNGKKASASVTVVNSSQPTVPVTSVSLNKTSATIKINGSTTLTATVKPSNATNKTITWTSSNTSIATVSGGKVTGKKAGTVTITAKSHNGKTATAKITVTGIPVTGIKLDKTSLTIKDGGTATLKATITPSNATNKSVSWTSSNNNIATVSNGKITARKPGTVKITAKAESKSATATVTVTAVAVTGIKVSPTSASVQVGKTTTIKATVSPSNASNKTVTWSSANTSIATVNSSGVVTGKKVGTVKITAKAGGKSATATITVKKAAATVAVTSVTLNKTSATINKNASVTLTATVKPTNATNKTITWSSSNTSIATVSGGKVTGKKAGTVTITAKSHNGKTATAKITVVVPVSGVSLNRTSANVLVGGSVTIGATVSPSDASNKSVTWTSSNTSIATVSGGKVVGKKAGTVTITAKTHNGKTATAKVTVHNKPSLSVGATTIMDEHTTTASAKNVSGTISWSSSNTSIFTVNSSGTIKGKKPGSATLTMKAKNKAGGNVSLTQKITVREMKVLFVGNSKTYVNDIDKKFETISENRGYSVAITRVTKGGKTLEWNYNNQGAKIKKAYDYAILQEQTDASLKETGFYNGALKIAKALKSKNSAVKIYVRKTWHKKTSSSSQKKKANQVATNVASRIKKDAGVWSANTNDGDAIYAMQSKGYTVISDSVHQNALGSYVAASCISSKVFGFDPTKITTKAGISSSDSTVKTARSVVKDKCYNK